MMFFWRNNRLSLIVTVLATLAVAKLTEGNEEEANRLIDELYSSPGRVIDPMTTFATLKKLDDKFKETEAYLSQPELPTLLSYCKVTPIKCTFEFFEGIQTMKEELWEYRFTVVPYLDYCKHSQFETCKETLSTKVKSTVQSISPNERKIIEGIMGEGDTEEGEEDIVVNLARLLTQNDKKSVSKALNDRQAFQQVFDSVLITPCGQLQKLFTTMEIYDAMINEEPEDMEEVDEDEAERALQVIQDPFIMYWISNARVCQSIIENKFMFAEDTRQIIKSTSSHKKHFFW